MKDLAADSAGATAIEYALLASLIAMVIITTIATLGNTVFSFYSAVVNNL